MSITNRTIEDRTFSLQDDLVRCGQIRQLFRFLFQFRSLRTDGLGARFLLLLPFLLELYGHRHRWILHSLEYNFLLFQPQATTLDLLLTYL